MDRISELPDKLLVQILSLVPTKDAVATSVLSRRWQSLWTRVPRLVFHYWCDEIEYWRFLRFVDRSLLSHKAPVLESLHLQLGPACSPSDVDVWIGIAIARSARELNMYIPITPVYEPMFFSLPRSLYTCETLVVLKLGSGIHLDVPSTVFLRSLKTLHLLSVAYSDDKSFCRLLSNCPVLEDLVIQPSYMDDERTFLIEEHLLD